MSDYDDGTQLDPGYTGGDQPDTFGGHDLDAGHFDAGHFDAGHPDAGHFDAGHFDAGQEHSALDQLHADHASQQDLSQQHGVFEHDHSQAETTALQHGQHEAYSAGYDEGEHPSFTNDNIDDLQGRLEGLAGPEQAAGTGEAHLGVASN